MVGVGWAAPEGRARTRWSVATSELYKLHGVDVSLPFPLLMHIFTCDIPSKCLSASEMVKGC